MLGFALFCSWVPFDPVFGWKVCLSEGSLSGVILTQLESTKVYFLQSKNLPPAYYREVKKK